MSKKHLSAREKRQKQLKKQRLTVIMIIMGSGIFVAALLIYSSLRNAGVAQSEIISPAPRSLVNPVDNALGNPDAPVKIIEYSDFQCPACQAFYVRTEPLLVEKFVATGKVYFVFRSVGEFIGPESRAAAEAAYCAGDQGKFWEYHDILFTNLSGENVGAFSDERLLAFAKHIGLNLDEFKACFQGRKYQERVSQDAVDASQAGVTATPSFVLNGKLLVGALPIEEFEKEIMAALNK